MISPFCEKKRSAGADVAGQQRTRRNSFLSTCRCNRSEFASTAHVCTWDHCLLSLLLLSMEGPTNSVEDDSTVGHGVAIPRVVKFGYAQFSTCASKWFTTCRLCSDVNKDKD